MFVFVTHPKDHDLSLHENRSLYPQDTIPSYCTLFDWRLALLGLDNEISYSVLLSYSFCVCVKNRGLYRVGHLKRLRNNFSENPTSIHLGLFIDNSSRSKITSTGPPVELAIQIALENFPDHFMSYIVTSTYSNLWFKHSSEKTICANNQFDPTIEPWSNSNHFKRRYIEILDVFTRILVRQVPDLNPNPLKNLKLREDI